MAREIGRHETKIRFFAVESTQNDQIVSPKTGNELAEVAGRMTSQIAQNVCLFDLCQVFKR